MATIATATKPIPRVNGPSAAAATENATLSVIAAEAATPRNIAASAPASMPANFNVYKNLSSV